MEYTDIKPTKTIDEKKGEFYTLEDRDYLLISAIRQLSETIERLRLSINK